MKKTLGIDWGQAKLGLALSYGTLAEPYGVIRFTTKNEALDQIGDIILKEKVEQLVVGLPEGNNVAEIQEFGKELEKKFNVSVDFQSEVLTTKDAQTLALAAGIKRKKRKTMEDAFAAAIILQEYLDTLWQYK